MTATAALALEQIKKLQASFLKTGGCRQLASHLAMRMSPLKIDSAILRRRERLSEAHHAELC